MNPEEVKRAIKEMLKMHPWKSEWVFDARKADGEDLGGFVMDTKLGAILKRWGVFEAGAECGEVPEAILMEACPELFQ